MGLHSESGTMAVCESRKYRAKLKVKRSCRVCGETSLEIRRRRTENILTCDVASTFCITRFTNYYCVISYK